MVNEPEEVRRPMAGCSLMGLLPGDFWAHARAARREKLLSWRSLLDAGIERLQETPAGAGQKGAPKCIPSAFWSHRRAACREELLAFRSLVDAFVHLLDGSSPAERATRIDIL